MTGVAVERPSPPSLSAYGKARSTVQGSPLSSKEHWVETRANELLREGNVGVKRLPFNKAIAASRCGMIPE